MNRISPRRPVVAAKVHRGLLKPQVRRMKGYIYITIIYIYNLFFFFFSFIRFFRLTQYFTLCGGLGRADGIHDKLGFIHKNIIKEVI